MELPPGLEWPEGAELGDFQALDPEQLQSLSEALRGELLARMEALADAGLLSELALSELEGLQAGEGDKGLLAQGELCEDCAKGEP